VFVTVPATQRKAIKTANTKESEGRKSLKNKRI